MGGEPGINVMNRARPCQVFAFLLLSTEVEVFNLGMEIDMTISVPGIDIAKNTFQLHGTDNAGNPILKKRLPRNKLAAFVANFPQLLNCVQI